MFLQQIVNGLTMGVMYSLLALGYSLIFGALDFINFAHGQVAMFGAYVAWWASVKAGMPFLVACALAIAAAAAVGIVMERFGFKPIRNAPKLAMITASVGFSYIVQTAVQLMFGTEPYAFTLGNAKVFHIGNVSFSTMHIGVLVISVALMVGLELFIKYTRPGRAIRAISLDKVCSGLMGVNVDSTVSLTFGIGSALGAFSCIMMSLYYSQVYSTIGTSVGDKAFAAVVLGGAGSVPGAMIGGVVMGLVEAAAGTVLTSNVKEAVAYVVMILVLVFKPSGLLGKEVKKD